ncbi:MAG TPA: RnfABCDGE type electron transport complex subunit G [Candidatus Mediterraneibacter colneyensis]|nr:RnfABCDGE type electron transport complex subunit G [Candidatus Mediterraneibacter colneyensis]
MNKIVKNTLILTAITVVAGLLLGIVYDITKEPIAQAQENTRQEAYRAVLPDADSFEEVEDFDTKSAQSILAENGYDSDEITTVVSGLDKSGSTIGYVINVMSHEAYDGDLELSVGIASDGTVKGIEMLSISETAGLGMKADEADFKDQFKDQNVDRFTYTKNGENGDGMIDAISGATITTNAVTNAVDSALVYYQSELSSNESGGEVNE